MLILAVHKFVAQFTRGTVPDVDIGFIERDDRFVLWANETLIEHRIGFQFHLLFHD
jgi:hypothetical protein